MKPRNFREDPRSGRGSSRLLSSHLVCTVTRSCSCRSRRETMPPRGICVTSCRIFSAMLQVIGSGRHERRCSMCDVRKKVLTFGGGLGLPSLGGRKTWGGGRREKEVLKKGCGRHYNTTTKMFQCTVHREYGELGAKRNCSFFIN